MFKKDYTKLTDEKLVSLICKGKKKAFDEIYGRYSKRLLAYFKRMLWQDDVLAEDFLHDLFLKLIEKPEAYKPEKAPFRAWFFSVAHNMCKNEYRRRGNNPQESLLKSNFEIAPSVMKQLHSESFDAQLMHVLQRLPEEQRHIFLLRYQQEMSIKQIAEQLLIPEGTVKSRIFYTLKKLSQELKEFTPNQ